MNGVNFDFADRATELAAPTVALKDLLPELPIGN
jgi:hypothetical protein